MKGVKPVRRRRRPLQEPSALDFRVLFESAPGLFLVLDPGKEFTILGASDAYLAATLTRRESIVGRGLFAVFPDNPDDPTATGTNNLRASLGRVLATRAPDAMAVQKYDIRRPEEAGGGFEERYWSPLNSPVLSAQGAVTQIIHRVEDVTEFVRAARRGDALQLSNEAARLEILQRSLELHDANRDLRETNAQLKEREAELRLTKEQLAQYAGTLEHSIARTQVAVTLADDRLRLLLEGLPDAVIVISRDRVVFANAMAESVFGYEAGALSELAATALLPDWSLIAGDSVVRNADGLRPISTTEVTGRRKDGKEFPAEVSASPARTPDGVVVTCTIRDLTLKKASEEQLRQAQKMEAVGELTGGIAHDFNNVLTVIVGGAEVARERLPRGTPGRDEVDEILTAAQRGAAMVGQLLRFSRRSMLEMKPVNPQEVVRSVSGMVRRVIPSSIRLEVAESDNDCGTIVADIGAIEQMLLNLCNNARDAMPAGGILRIACDRAWLDAGYHTTHPWVAPGEYVCISVADTGIGMDAETQRRIFEPFFTTKPQGVGTGLGMAMVYGLMKQHNGMVHVYSELGKGAMIKLYLPVAHAALERQDRALPRQVASPKRGSETVLLVEDDVGVLRATRRALESRGYSVLTAADGEEALDVYRTHGERIALIISDLVMPKLGGRQVAEALRQQGSTVKILFTSGYAPGADYREAAFPAGSVFLHKPWSLSDLFAKVRDLLDS